MSPVTPMRLTRSTIMHRLARMKTASYVQAATSDCASATSATARVTSWRTHSRRISTRKRRCDANLLDSHTQPLPDVSPLRIHADFQRAPGACTVGAMTLTVRHLDGHVSWQDGVVSVDANG